MLQASSPQIETKAPANHYGDNVSVIPIKDDSGKLKYLQQLPQVSIARSLFQVLSRYQQEFGLTPSARTRIQVPLDAGPEDELEAFLRTKHG